MARHPPDHRQVPHRYPSRSRQIRKETMKQKRTNISDLNVDMLKHIMSFSAQSSDGAGSFARAISVCKEFMELSEDKDILKAVVFEKESVAGCDESIWQIDGLLSKCAFAGNMAAGEIVLMYLEKRVSALHEKLLAIFTTMMDFQDRTEVVFTRARMRAALSASKEVSWMLDDAKMDASEISEHLKRLKRAIAEEKCSRVEALERSTESMTAFLGVPHLENGVYDAI